MIKILAAVILLLSGMAIEARSQDTLPGFTATARPGNRNVISWTNPFPRTTQISIQRSADSTRNFKTILTVPDPTVAQNGFVDTKAPSAEQFYRLFIVLGNGQYQFSRSRRPARDTATTGSDSLLQTDNQRVVLDSLSNTEVVVLKEKLKPAINPAIPKPEKIFVVKKRDTVVRTVTEKNMKKFQDSIVYSTHDTLVFASVDTILIKPFVPKEIYRASKYVYTEKYGNVMISLPEAREKKYAIHFFEEDKSPLFEIKEVQQPSLILDKANFVHAGWFWFELYENGSMKERNRFFIPRDF